MSKPNHDFNLPRRTRLGAIVLLVVLFIAVIIWRVIPSFIQPKADKEEQALQSAWAKYEKELPPKQPSYPEQQQHYRSDRKDNGRNGSANATLFPFNPNTASEDELLKLGLPPYTVKTILKYRARSATTFRKKEDLQRLYTLRKEDYERIAPYIRIPESSTPEPYASRYVPFAKGENKIKQESKVVELNAATADELMSLKGIGPGYSKRIINYRDALGGFFRVDQLTEVYGFPDSVYQQLKEKFTVDVTLVKHINVNIADEETLAKDPYIGRRMASNIIKLRNGLKEFKEIEQLRQVPLINEEKYRKIAPYLSTH